MSRHQTPYRPRLRAPHHWCPTLHPMFSLLYFALAVLCVFSGATLAILAARVAALLAGKALNVWLDRRYARKHTDRPSPSAARVHPAGARAAALLDLTCVVLFALALIGMLRSGTPWPASSLAPACAQFAFVCGAVGLNVAAHRFAVIPDPAGGRR